MARAEKKSQNNEFCDRGKSPENARFSAACYGL